MSARAGHVAVSAEHLDADRIAAILAERAARIGGVTAAAAAPHRDHLVWTLAGTRFASPLASVAGVLSLPPLTRIPGAPRAWLGVVQHRGRLLNVFDASDALGVDPAQAADSGCMLILRDAPKPLAIRIGGVQAIHALPLASIPDDDATAMLTHLPTDGGMTIVSMPLLTEHLLHPNRPSKG